MVRDEILELLRSGKTISGGELSRRFRLSRTAIWKAITSLRQEGYHIDARTGSGYRLTGLPDALTEREIRNFLHPVRTVGRTILCYDEIDSTNTKAKQLAMSGAEDGTVVAANCQTAGRGRMERSFQSPRDKGIYLSVLLRPSLPSERLASVTAMTGVAVCRAVERQCGVRPGLKWPNDPVLHGRKICGILTELSLEGETGKLQYLVTGIGINVSQTAEDFTPEVAEIASSLVSELGEPVSRPPLAAALIEELDRVYAALISGETGEYLSAYRRDCVNIGRQVQMITPQGRETAEATGIDASFGLIIRDRHGRERVIRSGEVSVRGLYGYADGAEQDRAE